MSSIIFNSWSTEFKTPFGALTINEAVTFSIAISNSLKVRQVHLLNCIWNDWNNPIAHEMALTKEDDGLFSYSVTTQFTQPTVYGYIFKVTYDNGYEQFIKKDPKNNSAFLSKNLEGNHWQQTVYNPEVFSEKEIRPELMYQIFPDRFCKSSGDHTDATYEMKDWYLTPPHSTENSVYLGNKFFYGGNLKGIIEKLPYIESLGVTMLYIMPTVHSSENHGYATVNFLEVSPLLGTWDDFWQLCNNAHARGMKVILDAVFSHVGKESIYFKDAISSLDSPYIDWFHWYQYPYNYQSWWGIDTLPTINKSNKEYQNFILQVVDLWFENGIDGLRLDVADDLPVEFLQLLVSYVKDKKRDALIIGEVWEDASTKGDKFYFSKGLLDGVMNYPFRTAILDYIRYGNSSIFYNDVMTIVENYPKEALTCSMNLISSHDRSRAITRLVGERIPDFYGDDVRSKKWQAENDNILDYQKGKHALKLSSIIQYFFPATPCLYYGDEAGLTGYRDPFNRKAYPWGKEDHELIAFFQEIGGIRKSHPFLGSADFRFLNCTDNYLSFERYDHCGNSIMVYVNRNGDALNVPINCYTQIYELKKDDRVVAAILSKQSTSGAPS